MKYFNIPNSFAALSKTTLVSLTFLVTAMSSDSNAHVIQELIDVTANVAPVAPSSPPAPVTTLQVSFKISFDKDINYGSPYTFVGIKLNSANVPHADPINFVYGISDYVYTPIYPYFEAGLGILDVQTYPYAPGTSVFINNFQVSFYTAGGVPIELNLAEYTTSDGYTYASYGSGTVSVSAVPEPSTWIMMLLGCAGLGFAGYRRNKAEGAVVNLVA